MALFTMRSKATGTKFCGVCSQFRLDSSVEEALEEDGAKEPTVLLSVAQTVSNWRRHHLRGGYSDGKPSVVERMRNWQEEASAVPLTEIAAQANAGCKPCKVLEGLVHRVIPNEFAETLEYVEIGIRRSYLLEHQDGLFFMFTGRPRYDKKIMNNTFDDLALKVVFSIPWWKPVKFPVEMYCAAGTSCKDQMPVLAKVDRVF